MLNSTLSRFAIRRRQLKERGLCCYCGAEPAAEEKTICHACSAIKALKRNRASPIDQARRKLERRRSILIDLLSETQTALEKKV
jgi:hypothetical protein